MSGAELGRTALALHDAARGGAVLRDGPRRRVTAVDLPGPGPAQVPVIVKEWRPRLMELLVPRALRSGPALRAASAAETLRAAGLLAPEVLAVVDDARQALVLRRVPGPTLQEALGAATRATGVRLAEAAAELVVRLRAAGLVARDCKPPNLVASSTAPVRLVLVDLDDLRRAGAGRAAAGATKALVALDAYGQLGPRPLAVGARLAALRLVAARTGDDPRRLLRLVLPRARAKRRAIEARGKEAPGRGSPVGPRPLRGAPGTHEGGRGGRGATTGSPTAPPDDVP